MTRIKNTDDYLQEFRKLTEDLSISVEALQFCLDRILDGIELLENIYMTGGKNKFYSATFENAAINERQDLCYKSSALHSLIREMKNE